MGYQPKATNIRQQHRRWNGRTPTYKMFLYKPQAMVDFYREQDNHTIFEVVRRGNVSDIVVDELIRRLSPQIDECVKNGFASHEGMDEYD